MDRHVKWLRRRIIASVATQTAEVFAVVAVAAFALMYWRTSEGPLTSLLGAVVVAQLVAGARVGHAMRNNPLNYVFMRKYVERPFTYRVSRFQGEDEAHAVAERLPGFAPVATIRDRDADPEPVFDVYHDPSRLVAASVSRASGSVALVSSLADGRIMVTDARAIPPHERLVMNVTPDDSLDSVIAAHRRAISARSDVVELASSAHQVVLDSLAVEYDSYLALGPTLSPFLDLETGRRSWLRLSARISSDELAALPVRLGPDLPAPAPRHPSPETPTTVSPVPRDTSPEMPATVSAAADPVPSTTASGLVVPEVVAPEVEMTAASGLVVPEVVAPQVEMATASGLVVPEVVAPQVDMTTASGLVVPEVVAPQVDMTAPAPGETEVDGVLPPVPAADPEPETQALVDSLDESVPAPALSAVLEPAVVALVIPDPRKAPAIVEPVPVVEVDAMPDTVPVDAAPVVALTPFVTVEPDPVGIDSDPAPITAEVPAVVVDAPVPEPTRDLVAALQEAPTIDAAPVAVPEPAPIPVAAPIDANVAAMPEPAPVPAAAPIEVALAPEPAPVPAAAPIDANVAAMPEPAPVPAAAAIDANPAAVPEPAPLPPVFPDMIAAGPVGPPATLAEAVQPAPDSPAALMDSVLQQAPPADWQAAIPAGPAPAADVAIGSDADVPDLATALGYGGPASSSRPRLSAVLRANTPTPTAPPAKRSRRKSR